MDKDQAIAEVQRLIRDHNLSLKDYQSHSMKGVKLPAKAVGPNGETWAGRGMKPKWMTDASQTNT
jgi:DNA-binding protein H-NS